MWPGQQQPGGERNPQDQSQSPYGQPGYQQPWQQQPGYQQPNPYQQPGYQAPNPYQQPAGAPRIPGPGDNGDGGRGGGGNGKTKVIAMATAGAVVVAAAVTGFLLLGDKDDKNSEAGPPAGAGSRKPDPTADSDGDEGGGSSDGDGGRGTDGDPKPTIKGWHVVVNPKWGTAFDVPPEWEVQNPGSAIALEDNKTGKPLMTMSAPAYLRPDWCVDDENKDGRTEDHELAAVGTKGANGAKNSDEVAVNQVGWWIYGVYTQPDKKSYTNDSKAQPYTTTSGIKGSIARAGSKNTPQRGKCATDGKAITFGFKNAAGEYVSWNLYGATGVADELPEKTVMKILSTVRTVEEPTSP
ncbi:hypothetical protein ABZ953_33600 [Streptomyces sp. NPDC046465]|uniref:hypothetical protein n=1 Tax=Streptomyces sp. NPDC046465 TaxID=3155810 RepID=UPI0033DB9511